MIGGAMIDRATKRAPWHGRLLALALITYSSSGLAQELGRLFATPEQRAALDVAREAYDPNRREVIVKRVQAAAAPPPPPPSQPMPELLVEGLVIRSSGHNAAWVNGTGMLSGETTADGIRVEADKTTRGVRFVLPSGDGTSAVKPGQLLNPDAGEVREQYILPPDDEAAPKS